MSNNDNGFVLWLTGLSGAGKSTIANAVAPSLVERGHRVEVLDGDEVRTNLCQGLGFSREDRDTNIARIGYVAGKLAKHGVAVVVAAISPYQEARDKVRAGVSTFIEVHVAAPVATCAERDTKGLYAKAMAGEIKNQELHRRLGPLRAATGAGDRAAHRARDRRGLRRAGARVAGGQRPVAAGRRPARL